MAITSIPFAKKSGFFDSKKALRLCAEKFLTWMDGLGKHGYLLSKAPGVKSDSRKAAEAQRKMGFMADSQVLDESKIGIF